MNQDDNWVTGDHLFGLDTNADSPIFRSHLDKDEMPVSLTSWTAKDFSEIYVRFYPHLVRHARKFLNNNLQSEEVVQDAFLYLMTSLPEIDSEIGVLKLLKWKVRLLSLDVIRAQGKNRVSPIDDGPELAGDQLEIDEQLIRADDAAIVSLALAKLAPRQREALIASVYEEKATVEVAEQLMLSENATRQLVFRAKAAFKKALVGEADTQGLAVSELLSLATKKARRDAARLVPLASALAITLAISIGLVSNQGIQVQNEAGLSDSRVSPTQSLEPIAPAEMLKPEGVGEGPGDDSELQSELSSKEKVIDEEIAPAADSVEAVGNVPDLDDVAKVEGQIAVARPVVLGSPVQNLNSGFSVSQPGLEGERTLMVYGDAGFVASVIISGNPESGLKLLEPSFKIFIDGVGVTVLEDKSASTTNTASDRTSLTMVATGLTVLFDKAQLGEASYFGSASVTLSVDLDRLGQPIQANLFVNQ